MGFALVIANLFCLYLFGAAIRNSQKRVFTFFCGVGALVLVCVLGAIAIFVLMSAQASVIDTNEILNKAGNAIQFFAPIAAVAAASKTKRRS